MTESNIEQNRENGKKLLLQTSGLEEDNTLVDMILKSYQMILEGCGIDQLRKSAENTMAILRTNVEKHFC